MTNNVLGNTALIDYVKSELEGKLFSDLVSENSILQQTLHVFDHSISVSIAKQEFLDSNIESIKSRFNCKPKSTNPKYLKKRKLNGAAEIESRGYFAIINYPDVSVNQLVDSVFRNSDFKRYNIRPRKNYNLQKVDLNQLDRKGSNYKNFNSLTENEKYDALVDFLVLGGSQAVLLGFLRKKLDQIKEPVFVSRGGVKRGARPKKPTQEFKSLKELFKTRQAYESVMLKLVEEGCIDSSSFYWIDKSPGYKSQIAALIFQLYNLKYLQLDLLPTPLYVKTLARDAFNVEIGERTIKGKKIFSLRKSSFAFIKLFQG
jgi:hypothetical protein